MISIAGSDCCALGLDIIILIILILIMLIATIILIIAIIIVIFVLETFSNSLDLLIMNRDLQNSYYPNLHHQACIGTWEKFVCACQPAVKGRAGRAEYRAGSTN